MRRTKKVVRIIISITTIYGSSVEMILIILLLCGTDVQLNRNINPSPHDGCTQTDRELIDEQMKHNVNNLNVKVLIIENHARSRTHIYNNIIIYYYTVMRYYTRLRVNNVAKIV